MHSNRPIPNIASATLKGEWQFIHGKRGVVLVMHKPRLSYIPDDVFEKLYKVDKLIGKSLVVSVHACPRYSMCFSDKCAFTLIALGFCVCMLMAWCSAMQQDTSFRSRS